MKGLKQKLKKKSKEWLVDRLFELCVDDETIADRILLRVVADDDVGAECVTQFKRQLDKAVEEIVEHGPGNWKFPLSSTSFDIVADALAAMMPKNLEAVVETSEYALVKLDSVFELQDECELEDLVDTFRELHLEACDKLKPDPCSLGKRLAELKKATEWGFFDGPPEGYSELLGRDGLAAYLSKKS